MTPQAYLFTGTVRTYSSAYRSQSIQCFTYRSKKSGSGANSGSCA